MAKKNKQGQLKVEYVAIDSLKEWERNPRQNEQAVASVVTSIEKFGYTNPILARRADRRIIAGHTRVKALKQIGETKVPVIFLDIGESEADLYAIFDNKSVENTPWDIPKLSDLFVNLKDIGADLTLSGFSAEEIKTHQATKDDIKGFSYTEENLKPFKKTHILFSFEPKLMIKIQEYIEAILKIEGIEYEQCSN